MKVMKEKTDRDAGDGGGEELMCFGGGVFEVEGERRI
jgi:hypothetical protein